MEREQIIERVCDIVSEHLALPMKYVKKNLNTPFIELIDEDGDPACDDLDFTELLMAFEEEFGIEIGEEDEQQCTNISDAVEFILNF